MGCIYDALCSGKDIFHIHTYTHSYVYTHLSLHKMFVLVCGAKENAKNWGTNVHAHLISSQGTTFYIFYFVFKKQGQVF